MFARSLRLVDFCTKSGTFINIQKYSSTTKYELLYLPLRGRAEGARYILHQAGVQFDDVRLDEHQWAALKPHTPMQQLPILRFDNNTLCQSRAIQRYLAKSLGLVGKDAVEEAFADMYIEGIADIISEHREVVAPLIQDNNQEKSKAAWKCFRSGTLKLFMERYEKFLKENGSGWLVGDSVTWADLVIAEMFDKYQRAFDKRLLENYPLLADHTKAVHELPRIKQYVATRPTTAYEL